MIEYANLLKNCVQIEVINYFGPNINSYGYPFQLYNYYQSKSQPPPSPTVRISHSKVSSLTSKFVATKNNRMVVASASNSTHINDVSTQKGTISNFACNQSFGQNSINLSHEVPDSTPEVDGNNGTISGLSGEILGDPFGNNTISQNMTAPKVQILDGEKTM